MAVKEKKLSPAMRQYQDFKDKHPGYVLFFRMGDFYEVFHDDAKLCSRTLGITLTARQDKVPMAGVPYHQLDNYLKRMIVAGHRVAICEQVEDAKQAKGLVKRDVTRLVTPGTLTDEPMLDSKAASYLAAVAFGRKSCGIAWVDLSTGQLLAASGSEREMFDEAGRLAPAEMLVPESSNGDEHPAARELRGRGVTGVVDRPGWQFSEKHGLDEFRRYWGVSTAVGYGFADDDPAVAATGAVLTYLEETQRGRAEHVRPPVPHEASQYLRIDPSSWRNLEVDRTLRGGSTDGSLLAAVDRTQTPMGGRLLREWLRSPLTDVGQIESRQDSVAELRAKTSKLTVLRERLSSVCDIERIVGRLAVSRAGPRDLAALRDCLSGVPALLESLSTVPAAAGELPSFADFAKEQSAFLTKAIAPEPPANLRDGNVIAKGFDKQLDELRTVGRDGRQWLAEYQAELCEETGIPSLKIGYNRVFGYYVEVTNAHKDKAPDAWARRQSTKNAERFVTE
ncbi:MAG: DNA mismatch repair protein MutS, partial [Planctomycetota bacterium]